MCNHIYIYIIHYIKQLGIIWVGCPIMTTTMTTTNKPTALDSSRVTYVETAVGGSLRLLASARAGGEWI